MRALRFRFRRVLPASNCSVHAGCVYIATNWGKSSINYTETKLKRLARNRCYCFYTFTALCILVSKYFIFSNFKIIIYKYKNKIKKYIMFKTRGPRWRRSVHRAPAWRATYLKNSICDEVIQNWSISCVDGKNHLKTRRHVVFFCVFGQSASGLRRLLNPFWGPRAFGCLCKCVWF